MGNANYSKWDSIFELVNPDNTMTFNRLIAHAIGAVETIIFFSLLSKMKYYMNRDMLDSDGFFYATELDIQESTTFTKRVQAPAIAKLTEIGLIETKRAGLPARRYFRIICDRELFVSLIEQGEEITESIRNKTGKTSRKPHSDQKLQNVTSCDNKMLQQDDTICHNRLQQNVTTGCDKTSQHSYKSKENNLKDNNQSINQSNSGSAADVIDKIDERERYRSVIKSNIEYEWYLKCAEKKHSAVYRLEQVDELIEIILDVICSSKRTIRVNGEEMPHEIVKGVFLKLKNTHIEFVLDSLENKAFDVINPRAYTITTLYNSFQTANLDEHI
ncbi:MAG: DUF6017 domain-containing protein [Eubacterium sp.]|nr:DUF6017 domain-containing protein [Eubacterium sp.]